MLLNGREIEMPHSPEFQQVVNIVVQLAGMGLRPYRTELSMFHCGLLVAGQADAIFVDDSEESMTIIDWKRTPKLSRDNAFRALKPPFEHLPDCNYWTYALQLNIYRFILETEYSMRVKAMYLAQVHPSIATGRLVGVPAMDDELALLCEDQISKGLARCEAIDGSDAPFVLL